MKSMNKIDDYFGNPIKKSADGRTFNVFSGDAVTPTESLQLMTLVEREKPGVVLEVGTGPGASAVAMGSVLERLGAGKVITLDPFQEEIFGNVGVSEFQRLDLEKWVEFRSEFAEDFLYKADTAQVRFDFIFLDGAHSIGMKMTHTFFANKCLKSGGILAFHDVTFPCTAACVKYLIQEKEYSVVKLPIVSPVKTLLRMIKYCWVYGRLYGIRVIPYSHLNLIVLRKGAT